MNKVEKKNILQIVIFLFISLFLLLVLCSCNSQKTLENKTEADYYEEAKGYILQKKYPQAIGVLREIKEYEDSRNLIKQLQYIIDGSYIASNYMYISGITRDGKVITSRGDYGKTKDVSEWENIHSLCSVGMYLEAITTDDVILTSDPNSDSDLDSEYNYSWAIGVNDDGNIFFAKDKMGSYVRTINLMVYKELLKWKDITSIKISSYLSDYIGLKEDGTLAFLSESYPEEEVNEIKSWSNIIAVEAGYHVYGLTTNGEVLSSNKDTELEDWKDIIAISSARDTIIGLKRDGTVLALGDNEKGQCNVSDWRDIVAIDTDGFCTIGLKSDGTLVRTTDISNTLDLPDMNNFKDLYIPEVIFNK